MPVLTRVLALTCLSLAITLAHADATYQETVQVTGGALVDTLKQIPFMPKSMKQILEPIVSRKALHGNQLVSTSRLTTEIIDLDQETVTQIDNEKRTYSVVTFAQVRQAFKNAPKKLEEAQAKANQEQTAQSQDAANPPPQVKVTFEINVADTGVSKPINRSSAVLLPLPVVPTNPTREPLRIVRSTSRSTHGLLSA